PEEFKLFQNYPNPFNQQTTISYFLPRSTHLRIDIWDILGRNIATLVEEELAVGFHQVTWNTDLVSSGTYIYQMTAGPVTLVKKSILLK
ncbi:T9SS type A sorting domain-containing protein, partial [bacterium]|nr:T9SS type A sorting domain-containing protein [bacterium]